MEKRIDKETQVVLDDGKKLEDLVASDGWKLARHKLNQNILSVGNIMSIVSDDPTKVMVQLAARQVAIELVLDWLKDIEGTAAQHKSHTEQMAELHKEEYMMRFEEEKT